MGHKEVYNAGVLEALTPSEKVFQSEANVAAEAMRSRARELGLKDGVAVALLWEDGKDAVSSIKSLKEFKPDMLWGVAGWTSMMPVKTNDHVNIFLCFSGGGAHNNEIREAGLQALGIKQTSPEEQEIQVS